MNILVVYAHHEPTSLTSALKNTTSLVLSAAGNTVVESDLYAIGFQPLAEKVDFATMPEGHFNYMLAQKKAAQNGMAFSPDIAGEIAKLQAADMVIFHFPIWWFSVPAILKGWFDRVLAMGVTWDGHGATYEHGLLRGKKALLVAVAGGRAELYKKDGRHRATIEEVLMPINRGTLAFCGMDVLEPYVIYDSLGKTQEELTALLNMYSQFIAAAPASEDYIEHFTDSPTPSGPVEGTVPER